MMAAIMVNKDELLLRIERLKMRLNASADQEEREIIARLIWALLELIDATYPDVAVVARRCA
jgi:hypothetical protein